MTCSTSALIAAAAPVGILFGRPRVAARPEIVPGDGHWLRCSSPPAFLGITAGVRSHPERDAVERDRTTRPQHRRGPRWSAIGVVAGVPVRTARRRRRHHHGARRSTSSAGLGMKRADRHVARLRRHLRHPRHDHARRLRHDIDWRFALLLAVGVVPGARLGAGAALRASDRRLRLLVATFLGATAVVYAAGELAAMR